MWNLGEYSEAWYDLSPQEAAGIKPLLSNVVGTGWENTEHYYRLIMACKFIAGTGKITL